MAELLKSSFLTHTFVAIFTGFLLFRIVFGIIKKAKKIENRKMRIILCIAVSSVLSCFWFWFFVYHNLYPISLAYYEYNQDVVEEKFGIIDSIEQDGKDRMHFIIDNKKYTMVYSSVSPFFNIIANGDTVKIRFGENSKFIDEGDMVQIQFGEKSMYIFDINIIEE